VRIFLAAFFVVSLFTSAAVASMDVRALPSRYPVALSCALSTADSPAGTPNYYCDFSAAFTNTGSRSISSLLLKFTLMSGRRTLSTRVLLDSGGVPAHGNAKGTWRLIGLPPGVNRVTCTITGVSYQ
jgi:hypothetical protein